MDDGQSMVERVAVAINRRHEELTGRTLGAYPTEIARAAIEAMREPTAAMLDVTDYTEGRDHYPRVVYQDMIDAALSQETPDVA